MKQLRPSLVFTVSLSMTACGTRTTNPPQPEMTHNPPMPQPTGQGASSGGASTAGGAGAREAASAKPALSSGDPPPPAPRQPGKNSTFKEHPRDVDGNVVFKNRDGSCFVEIPVPTTKPREPGERSVRIEKLVCPPVMSDPAYAKCVGGAIHLKDGACWCLVGGNPPPARVALDCPAQ